jgi:hypothetical protein
VTGREQENRGGFILEIRLGLAYVLDDVRAELTLDELEVAHDEHA